MKKILLLPNPQKDRDMAITKSVAAFFIDRGATVYLDEKYSLSTEGVEYYSSFPKDAELIAVVGGDGSILDASVYAYENDIPIVGINAGRLGYLGEIEPDDLSPLAGIFTGSYHVNELLLLAVEYTKAGVSHTSLRLAVNDVVISHDNYLGIADFQLNTTEGGVLYRADGIIISTPQGSTAYALSAGGPMLSHEVDAMLVTPVCPHSFFNRSLIFNSGEVLTVKNTGNEKLNISVDGRCVDELSSLDECTVKAAGKRLKMLSFKTNNMFSTLFKKMSRLGDIT